MIRYISKFMNESQNIRKLKTYNDKLMDFSSNDYLNLSNNPDSMNAGYAAAIKYGTGSTGSRLLSGNAEIFTEFESEISQAKGFESGLIYNSGFIANYSVISAFCIPDACVIFDKLNHASMYAAVNNSAVQLIRYRHLDYDQLEDILKSVHDRPKIIASETVFGMDGDIADLHILSSLADKYSAVLYLDEAHATGLYGKNGYGLSTTLELNPESTIVMGTFSKALASNGAYVVSRDIIKQYLIQVSRGFIYSTALSPFNIGVARYNWHHVKDMHKERKKLLLLAHKLRTALADHGYKVKGHGTNIIPILFDNVSDMFHVHDQLLKDGFLVSAIRKPTSPTPRLRIALNAAHTNHNVESLLEVLRHA